MTVVAACAVGAIKATEDAATADAINIDLFLMTNTSVEAAIVQSLMLDQAIPLAIE